MTVQTVYNLSLSSITITVCHYSGRTVSQSVSVHGGHLTTKPLHVTALRHVRDITGQKGNVLPNTCHYRSSPQVSRVTVAQVLRGHVHRREELFVARSGGFMSVWIVFRVWLEDGGGGCLWHGLCMVGVCGL